MEYLQTPYRKDLLARRQEARLWWLACAAVALYLAVHTVGQYVVAACNL